MRETLFWANKLDHELVESTTELLHETLRNIILTGSIIFGLWLFMAGLYHPEAMMWQFWVVFAGYIGTFRLAFFLLQKNDLQAELAWLAGMTFTSLAMIFLLKTPDLIFFFALLPFIAVVTLGWRAGLAAGGVVCLIVWALSNSPLNPLLAPFYLATLIGGGVFGILGWATSQTLLATTHWATHYFNQSVKNLEDARQHRAQLVVALKNLDLAYYRLERANAALVAAWKEAEDAERFKSEFTTYISHEMRTPLNLIAGFSETILTSPESYGSQVLPGAYREDVNKISQSAQILLRLIDDIIDLAKVDVGKIALVREKVDMKNLVTEAVEMVRDYIHARGLEIRVKLPEEAPAVWVDRLRIRQVLLNLLVNAVRFTERGWIQVEMLTNYSQAVLRVSDSGKGIAEENLPKVFEEFHTSDISGSAWHSGGGLGLPISKKLVELHQGQIGVESQLGKGSTFWFSLPLEYNADAHKAALRPYTAEHFLPKSNERILVAVHSDPHIASLFHRYLDGYRVMGASSLEEGFILAEENKAIAIIIDSQQPFPLDLHGLTFIQCPFPDRRRTAEGLGVVDLLHKPVTSQELLTTIDQAGRPVERVLIVDDEPDMVNLLRRMLATRCRAENCLEAWNGLEALEIMKKNHPDLVLLDITLPDINGREVIARMADDPELAVIPVIVVSGTVDDYTTIRLMQPVAIQRQGGFQIGEIIRLLDASLAILAPGWQPDSPTVAAPEAETAA
jgi:signal transduction histidine kinase/CheY-like chemotaxis protein